MDRNLRRGYVPYEVAATIALIVVMTIAVGPPLLDNLRAGKIDRARSEAEIIGHAILDFHTDVGQWPLIATGEPIAHGRLVGNASVGGGNVGLPTGLIASGSGGSVPQGIAMGTVTAHLVNNRDANGAPIYTTSGHPYLEPGWNGPYLEEVPLDPWGHPYVIDIQPFRHDSLNQVSGYDSVIVVASCGPNQRFETVLPKVEGDDDFAGDDVGFVIRSARDRTRGRS
jgi:hypothetical protein